jgi:hypothetical protein
MESRHLSGSEFPSASRRTGLAFGLLLALTVTVHVTMLLILALHNFSSGELSFVTAGETRLGNRKSEREPS